MSIVYVFVLGRAGCGKSAATRYMTTHLPQKWEIERITDYKLLHDMFHNGDPRFHATQLDGFDVIDFSVLDEVLDEVQVQARTLEQRLATKNTLVTIEFARDDYKQALQRFDNEFLKKSYFLFIDAELETCIERVHQRINQKPTRLDNLNAPDDLLNNHFVSDTILRSYYHSSQYNLIFISNHFHEDFSIDPQRIQFIENSGGFKEFTDRVDRFLKDIILATAGQPILVGATSAPGQVLLKAANALPAQKIAL